jgi:NEDD4-binding protein 2
MSNLTFQQYLDQKRPDLIRPGEKVCIIMRGLSGSGKSFTAREQSRKYGGTEDNIFSTDDFFVSDVKSQRKAAPPDQQDDTYWNELEGETYRANWNPEKLHAAHNWNHRRVEEAMKSGLTPIVVDNTNIRPREIRPYIKMAEQYGYKPVIQEPTSPWWNDHAHMLHDKQKYGKELEDFARYLAGYHQGYEQKYGARGNVHGVPLDTIRNMIRRWQPNLTVDKVLNPDPRND